MTDPNDFAEMSRWVIYLVLPEEATIKEYDHFQEFYWHPLHSLKEKKKIYSMIAENNIRLYRSKID